MKKFFIRLLILLPFLLIPFLIYIITFANGKSDNYYLRFTTPRQKSLILGTSRMAQGLPPSPFNESNLAFDKPLFNFSFTNNSSPYGPVYYKAIQKKLDPSSKNGLFILEVSPMSLMDYKANKANDTTTFEENETFLSRMHFMNMNPNFEYIFREYDLPYYNLLYKNIRNDENSPLRKYVKGLGNWASEITQDGWMKVTVPMDSISVAERKNGRLEGYKAYFEERKISPVRVEYLNKIIELLSKHGKVYLVRVPVDEKMLLMENENTPGFDDMITSIARNYKLEYINFSSRCNEFQTTDGNHLYKDSGLKVAKEIINKIKNDPLAFN